MRKANKVKKLFLFYSLAISLAVVLSACSSEEAQENKKIAYYKQHPEEVKNAMMNCIRIARQGGNIDHDADCIAIFKYEKQRCEMKHKDGTLSPTDFLNFNCNDKLAMGKLAVMGM